MIKVLAVTAAVVAVTISSITVEAQNEAITVKTKRSHGSTTVTKGQIQPVQHNTAATSANTVTQQSTTPNYVTTNTADKTIWDQKVGKKLTAAQRNAISAKARETTATLKSAQDAFVSSVAKAVKLPESVIRGFMPTIGADNTGFDKNIITKIEQAKGKAIGKQEIEAIRKADEAKKAKMIPTQKEFAAVIAEQAGISQKEAEALLPKVGL